MAEILTPIGNTRLLSPAGGAVANVGNVQTRSTTFHVANASSTVNVYVGIFPTYAQAIAMDHPSAGTDAGGLILTPNQSVNLSGNFGLPSTESTVYIAAITNVGTTSVFFTPIAE